MKKRILCLAMVLCMIAALLPISALAAEGYPTDATTVPDGNTATVDRVVINMLSGKRKEYKVQSLADPVYWKAGETAWVAGTESNYNVAIQRIDDNLTIKLKDLNITNASENYATIYVCYDGSATIELEGTNVIDNNARNVPACLRLIAEGGATITSVNGGTLTASARSYDRNLKNGSNNYQNYYMVASVIDTEYDLLIQNTTLNLSMVNRTVDNDANDKTYKVISHGIRAAGNVTIDNSNVTITNDFGAGIQLSQQLSKEPGSETMTNANLLVKNGSKLNIDVNNNKSSKPEWAETSVAVNMGGGNFEIDPTNGTKVTLNSVKNAFNKAPVIEDTNDYNAVASATPGDAAGATTYNLTAGTVPADYAMCYFDLKGIAANFDKNIRPAVENDLTLSYRVNKADATAANGKKVKIERANAEAYYVDLSAVEGDYYVVAYKNIAAKEIADEITMTVCDAEGNPVGMPKTDSIYLYAKRNMNSADANLNTLLADLLHYAAMAQTQFDYNKDNLVNAGYKNKGTEEMAACANVAAAATGAKANLYKATRFSLNYNISMAMKVSKEIGENSYAMVSFTNYRGTAQEAVKVPAVELDADNYYYTFNGLVAADGRCEVTWKFFNANNEEVLEVKDSMANYVGRNIEELTYLDKLMNYSDSAKNYLLNK